MIEAFAVWFVYSAAFFKREDDGQDRFTLLTWYLNNSKTTYSDRIFHADSIFLKFSDEYLRSASDKRRKKKKKEEKIHSP